MKTKPISIRFDENDLVLAQNLSGIKKPQKLVDLLIHEYVKHLKGSLIELPKDYMNIKNIGILNPNGKVEKIVIQDLTNNPPKTNFSINTMPKREDFESSIEFGFAKSEWKKKYNKQ